MMVIGLTCWAAAFIAIGNHYINGPDPAVEKWGDDPEDPDTATYMMGIEFDDDWEDEDE